jgi:hypothetical protein
MVQIYDEAPNIAGNRITSMNPCELTVRYSSSNLALQQQAASFINSMCLRKIILISGNGLHWFPLPLLVCSRQKRHEVKKLFSVLSKKAVNTLFLCYFLALPQAVIWLILKNYLHNKLILIFKPYKLFL